VRTHTNTHTHTCTHTHSHIHTQVAQPKISALDRALAQHVTGGRNGGAGQRRHRKGGGDGGKGGDNEGEGGGDGVRSVARGHQGWQKGGQDSRGRDQGDGNLKEQGEQLDQEAGGESSSEGWGGEGGGEVSSTEAASEALREYFTSCTR